MYPNLNRRVAILNFIGFLSSEHSKISFRHVSFPRVVEVFIGFEQVKCVREVDSILSIGFLSSSARNSMANEGLEIEKERTNIYISIFRALVASIVCFFKSA